MTLSVRHRTQTTAKRTVPGSKSSNTGRKEKLSKAEHEDAAVAGDGLQAEQKPASWLQPAKETVLPEEAWPHLTVSRFLASGTQEVLSKSPPSFSQSCPGQGHILSTLLEAFTPHSKQQASFSGWVSASRQLTLWLSGQMHISFRWTPGIFSSQSGNKLWGCCW